MVWAVLVGKSWSISLWAKSWGYQVPKVSTLDSSERVGIGRLGNLSMSLASMILDSVTLGCGSRLMEHPPQIIIRIVNLAFVISYVDLPKLYVVLFYDMSW